MSRILAPRHYVYRMDHDTGYAPKVHGRWCTLAGCKRSTVERWAQSGSWVVGIGGRGTGKPDRLIYALLVEDSLTRRELRSWRPQLAGYLEGKNVGFGDPVLVARRFYYFGHNAPQLPAELHHIRIDRQDAWRLEESDVERLEGFLARYRPGRHGVPNNSEECRTSIRVRRAC